MQASRIEFEQLDERDKDVNINTFRSSDVIHFILQSIFSSNIGYVNAKKVLELRNPAGAELFRYPLIERDGQLAAVSFGTFYNHGENRDLVAQEARLYGAKIEDDRPDAAKILADMQAQIGMIAEQLQAAGKEVAGKEILLLYPITHGHYTLNERMLAQEQAVFDFTGVHHTLLVGRFDLEHGFLIQMRHVDSLPEPHHQRLCDDFDKEGVAVERIPCDFQGGHLCAEHVALNTVGLFVKGIVPKIEHALSQEERDELAGVAKQVEARMKQLLSDLPDGEAKRTIINDNVSTEIRNHTAEILRPKIVRAFATNPSAKLCEMVERMTTREGWRLAQQKPTAKDLIQVRDHAPLRMGSRRNPPSKLRQIESSTCFSALIDVVQNAVLADMSIESEKHTLASLAEKRALQHHVENAHSWGEACAFVVNRLSAGNKLNLQSFDTILLEKINANKELREALDIKKPMDLKLDRGRKAAREQVIKALQQHIPASYSITRR